MDCAERKEIPLSLDWGYRLQFITKTMINLKKSLTLYACFIWNLDQDLAPKAPNFGL